MKTLFKACRENDLCVVKYLIENGSDVDQENVYGVTPLYVASWGGHLEVVKYLVEKGANINQKDRFVRRTPLWIAGCYGQIEVAEYLESKGAK